MFLFRPALGVALGAVVALLIWVSTFAAKSQTSAATVFAQIANVLTHPRCLNCHQSERPLQGDARRPHVPPVARDVSTMRCTNCHSGAGNNPASGVPGAAHWQLAPPSMTWQGLSTGELCGVLKDPRLNGNRSPQALLEHMEKDALVRWGWNPGKNREPVPVAHGEFVALLKVWVGGGAVCPS